ncbi:GNAT family N-acetyltransferase [Pedococcus sp. 2YAF34]|uniref:GNAT family N-acetyltransferase n=1 Tax=Pedococcus sp. 2YAF34 TaxID=3233032 RepID=UPI003F9CAB06
MAVAVRLALAADLSSVQGLEDAADQLFAELMDVSTWGSGPTGEERAAEPGFLLVAADAHGVVGFAHVLDLDGHTHLEQIAVLPERTRQGIGSVLLEEACRYAAEQGAREVTLRTFADVPWNAPFYARHGFVVLAPEPAWMAPLQEAEERVGLPRQGTRVAMVRHL